MQHSEEINGMQWEGRLLMEVPFTGRQFSLDPTHGVQLSSLPLLCYATPNPFPGGNPLAGGDLQVALGRGS